MTTSTHYRHEEVVAVHEDFLDLNVHDESFVEVDVVLRLRPRLLPVLGKPFATARRAGVVVVDDPCDLAFNP